MLEECQNFSKICGGSRIGLETIFDAAFPLWDGSFKEVSRSAARAGSSSSSRLPILPFGEILHLESTVLLLREAKCTRALANLR